MEQYDLNVASTTCRKCGRNFGRIKGNFPISYAPLYRGVGALPYCRECVEKIYRSYYDMTDGDQELSTRQVCRKLDIYWSKKLFDSVLRTSPTRSIITAYILKTCNKIYAGKCYDDTLLDEGTFWDFSKNGEGSGADTSAGESSYKAAVVAQADSSDAQRDDDEGTIEDVPDDVKAFWGYGNTPKMYHELQTRYDYWTKQLKDGSGVDTESVGVQAILRQICSVEIDINKNRAAGKSVDKLTNTLNSLLGSAMLKPAQNKDDDSIIEKVPLGVMTRIIERRHPIAEVDDRFKDVDGVGKYVSTWYLGHIGKMLGIKNVYTQLYEEAIEKLRVERPDVEADDDEDFLNEIFGNASDTPGAAKKDQGEYEDVYDDSEESVVEYEDDEDGED